MATWAIETLGWRQAYLVLASLPLLVALPLVAVLLREPPRTADGAAGQASPAAPVALLPGMTLGEAMRTVRFWVLWTALLVVSIGVGALIPNMVPILMADGLTAEDAAATAGLVGISVIVGRLVSGWLIDRVHAPLVAFVFLSVPALACLILAFPEHFAAWIALAAILVGLAAGAEFDLMAFMVSRYFGMAQYARIYSVQFIAFALGSGFVAPLPAIVRERTGSYDPALFTFAVLFLVGGVLMLAMGRYRYGVGAAAHDTPGPSGRSAGAAAS